MKHQKGYRSSGWTAVGANGIRRLACAAAAVVGIFVLIGHAVAQAPPLQPAPAETRQSGERPAIPPTPALPTRPASPPAEAHLTLEHAIELAFAHNHALVAERSAIDQNRSQETTANLRPNPDLSMDADYLPFFSPHAFSEHYFNQNTEFDVGLGYLFERGKKRQHRLLAAQDQTAVTVATVADDERTLTSSVAQQFIAALLAKANLDLAQTDLDSFAQSVQISEAQYQSGAVGENDLLKIKLQMLQFQMDLSSARLAKVQALAALRQLVGFESVPENYEVDGELQYQALPLQLDDLKMMALRNRPDYRAAELGVSAAQSQHLLARSDGKQDVTGGLGYSRSNGFNTASISFSIPLAIFNRNQGEIARTQFAVTQAQEGQTAASEEVLSDVVNAYENLRTNGDVVSLYTGGYLKEAEDSRDISQYAYQRGAASLLDYLDAERSYRATEVAYRQALASYMLAVEQMRQAVGTRNVP